MVIDDNVKFYRTIKNITLMLFKIIFSINWTFGLSEFD